MRELRLDLGIAPFIIWLASGFVVESLSPATIKVGIQISDSVGIAS
jgi:hypothetical protein